jgi:hypothetical protein
MDDLDFGDDPRRPRFFLLWLCVLRIRVGIALIAGALPAVVLYDLTGWGVASFILGSVIAIVALIFTAIYAPRY